MSFSGYQIRGDVLATMKQAAGNYMPEYGNWRYQLAKPPPPPPPPEEKGERDDSWKPPPDEIPTESGERNDAWTNPAIAEQTIVEPGNPYSDSGGTTYGYDNYYNALRAGERSDKKKYTHEEAKAKVDKYREGKRSGAIKPSTNLMNDSSRALLGSNPGSTTLIAGTEETSGTSHTTFDIVDGNEVNVVTTYTGTPRNDKSITTSNLKRSPMKSHGKPHAPTAVGPGGFKDPYAGVDKFLAKQINLLEINGSVATKDMHEHVKNIAGDIKDNVYLKKGKSNKETKSNKQEANSYMDTISKSFKEDLSKDGTVDTFYKMYKENLVSASITKQEKFILGTMMQMNNVKPMVDENKHMVYPIPMPTGETFPVTNQWLGETIEKRTKPYSTAASFSKNKGTFYEAGRAGHPWDKDSIIMQNKKLVASNPNQLASLLLDDGLFHPDPLINLILDREDQNESSPYTSSMGADIDNQELVLNAVSDPEARKELEADIADGLEKIGFAAYSRGKAEYDKENKKDSPTAGMSLREKKAFYQNNTNIA